MGSSPCRSQDCTWKEISSAMGTSGYMPAEHPRGQLERRGTDRWLQRRDQKLGELSPTGLSLYRMLGSGLVSGCGEL